MGRVKFGRWLSPDPAGLAAVDPTNPQSLNRYAYVGNNPTTLTDPTGLVPGLAPVENDNGGGCPFGVILDVDCTPVGAGGPEPFGGGWWPGGGGGGGGVGGGGGTPTGGSGAGGSGTSIGGVPSGGPYGGFGCEFGGCGGMGTGFVSGVDALPLSPWVFRVISWGWPILEAGAATAAADAAVLGGIVPYVLMQKGDAPPLAARSRFPTIQDLQRNCTPVGGPIIEPSSSPSRPGWTSEEQEYDCQGVPYTVHCLVSPSGASRQCHVRPGGPKGGGGQP